ncbi:tight junction protein ZO-3-like isoform X1 [Carcharodon carcharias]|uniref:tight junction protein ZO-3-like isoform X1 n=2 Tax=Carcharodon carcharias TaxID=13397 RepID=UPI001B7E16E8|nr:tight junction protein ZO-3-like isoform X1 [Carcharodon carcharias]
MAVRFQDQVVEMEETLIWEQQTVVINRDSKIGFGIAISGGKDKPNISTGETAILVSDVVRSGPAEGKILIKDRIVMVNGVSMENVPSSFAIQCLKSSGKSANITVKRPRKVQIPVTNTAPVTSYHSSRSDYAHDDASDEDEDYDPADRRLRRIQNQNLYHGDYHHSDDYDQDSGRNRSYNRSPSPSRSYGQSPSPSRSHGRSPSPTRSYEWSPSPSRSYDRSPSPLRSYNHQHNDQDYNAKEYRREHSPTGSYHEADQSNSHYDPRAIKKPIKSLLIKNKVDEEYGLRLGSQIFIKHMSSGGLASNEGVLKEGDIILKINGIVTENISLEDTRTLIEKSEGELRLVVLRDNEQFLINVPELVDSDENSLEYFSDPEPERTASPSENRSKRYVVHSNNTMKSNGSLKPNTKPVSEMEVRPTASKSPYVVEEPIYAAPVKTSNTRPQDEYNVGYSPDMKVARFVKDASVGLQLAGGNDVGIFVSRVLDDSPAARQGIQKGDQILQVNNVNFQNLTREEAVLLMLDIPKGEQVEIKAQRKEDIYKKMINSNVGDSFYVRTHFDHEVEGTQDRSFRRGEVFRVIDTMYKGKLGAWYAVRIGRDFKEQDKGTIPSKNRAEQIAKAEITQKASSSSSSGARAEFWKMRGLRGAKKNLRKSRDDLSALTIQGKFPPYERVILREASYKRPVVILGPISDIATQRLARDLPDQFELAQTVQRNSEEVGSSSVIKLETVRLIAQKNKHGLLDITPSAIERLNYVKWYPIVVFFNPENKQEVKAMRQHLYPQSRKSSKSLYNQAVKLRKYWSHLFTGTINLNSGSSAWFEALKATIKEQQTQPVWFPEEKTEETGTEGLELLNRSTSMSMDYLSCDESRANSDYEDTDAEGGAYTDNELDERLDEPAITRSSEPIRTEASQISIATAHATPTTYSQAQPQGQQRGPQFTRLNEQDLNAIKSRRDLIYSSDEDDDDDDEWNGPATEL